MKSSFKSRSAKHHTQQHGLIKIDFKVIQQRPDSKWRGLEVAEFR